MLFLPMTNFTNLNNKVALCPQPAVLMMLQIIITMMIMMAMVVMIKVVMIKVAKVMTVAIRREHAVFCFLSPCVTTYRQLWLSDPPAHPHPRNSELRKQWYRKFWKLVDMNGGWTHHKYIRKKRRPFGLDDSATVWVGVGSVREIMPQCILNLVRRIYPNPPEQPYMGLRVVVK